MTTRTKIIFFFIVSLAAALVAGLLSLENVGAVSVPTRGTVPVTIRVAVAPPLAPWVRAAAQEFGNQNPRLTVQIAVLEGLDADRSLGPTQPNLPDAWIAEASFVRGMAERIPYDAQGQSVAQTRLVWLAVNSRDGLNGNLDWETVHEAAVDPELWRESTGDNQFDLALPSPSNSVEGVAAFLSATADYHDQADLSSINVTDQGFVAWMEDILETVPQQGGSALTQLTSRPVAVDVGMLVESDLDEVDLNRFIQQSPAYNVIFDYPYLIRRGSPLEDAAEREQTAEQFRAYLLSQNQQQKLANYGFAQAGDITLGTGIQVNGDTAQRIQSRFGQ
jgi:hypothetical protein